MSRSIGSPESRGLPAVEAAVIADLVDGRTWRWAAKILRKAAARRTAACLPTGCVAANVTIQRQQRLI